MIEYSYIVVNLYSNIKEVLIIFPLYKYEKNKTIIIII